MDYKEFARENALGLAIGAVVAVSATLMFAPTQIKYQPMIEDRRPKPYGQDFPFDQLPPPPPPDMRAERPRLNPWHPGAPRNLQECLARGGIDLGPGCRGYR